MQTPPLTFAQFVCTAENRSAWLAVRDLADSLIARRLEPASNPLLLQGPTGTGKSHLLWALIEHVHRHCPDLTVLFLPAGDLGISADPAAEEVSADAWFVRARQSDLVIIEDLQHLPDRAVGPLEQMIDALQARRQPMIFTANDGPQRLHNRHGKFPARLISRLVSGMVVRLEPLSPESRLSVLRHYAEGKPINDEVLVWLANNLPGGTRQLLGALGQLETLAELEGRPVEVAAAEALFREQAEAGSITLDQIAKRVSGYFRVDLRELKSHQRFRHLQVPRQISMYLARQLTGLSLESIGAYFGGRDHTTVLHACRKVEEALAKDVTLTGAIRDVEAMLR